MLADWESYAYIPMSLSWGVWASLSKKSFIDFQERYHEPKRSQRGPFFGWLCSHIWIYPATLNLKTMVHPPGDVG
jgi:hypothetical protein